MVKACRIAFVVVALIVGGARSSSATTIGEFDYDFVDFLGVLDFTFTVQNLSQATLASGGDFTNVVVHLRQSGVDVDTVGLLDVTADAANSFQQASFIPAVAFDSAFLTFDFVDPVTNSQIPGTINPATLLLDGITSDTTHLDVFIDFTPADTTPPSPVPEPATLLTTLVGACAAIARRRRNSSR
jgi:hypothetical protein